MNFKGISFYLGLFCFPISILAFINILYSSYFDYFLSINSYILTLIISLIIGSFLFFVGGGCPIFGSFGTLRCKNVKFEKMMKQVRKKGFDENEPGAEGPLKEDIQTAQQ